MAFNSSVTTTMGTKGSDVYTASGVMDPRVALSALLVRGASAEMIRDGLDHILKCTDDPQCIEDAFVLIFQTRDIRGGKGERAISEIMWRHLLGDPHWKSLALALLELVPEYGSWRDLFVLAEQKGSADWSRIRNKVIQLAVYRLHQDEIALANGHSPSLLAKWIPREDRMSALAKMIAQTMYPDEDRLSRRLAAYRKRVSALNRAIQTTETKMCANEWETIDPSRVPGRCLQKHMKAFLNETKVKELCGSVYRPRVEFSLRHPDDEGRMACRAHFQEHLEKAAKGEAKVNGAHTVFPHELVRIATNDELSPEEHNRVVAVWNSMVAEAKEAGGLGRSLAMCDFSGSMRSSGKNGDTPYLVSMAMGLLISELTTDEFKNTMLTFDSTPRMITLGEGDLVQRVQNLHESDLGLGLSTDFQAAMDLILARLKATRCLPGDEPENLIVLTDMNWDQACGSNEPSDYTNNRYRHVVKTDPWQTHVEMIRESFKRAGEDMWGPGHGLKMPTIVIWNIAATSTDFHATSTTTGVVMLSGWSPSLFKVLQTKGVVNWTPMEALRIQLDNERYKPVRDKIRSLMASI